MVDRTGALQRRQRLSVIGLECRAPPHRCCWSPGSACRRLPRASTPLLPAAVERRLGDAVDIQIRGMLDTAQVRRRISIAATTAGEAPGRAALDKIMRRLEAAAALPFALRAKVVRRDEANAIALPGGQVYVFRGLIDKAGNADELAGVIAHEIGHVAHRDGTKAMLQGAGLSFLFGMLLGDFVGGGAVVIAAKTVLQSSYTREAETAADAYGAGLMNKAGGDARALAAILDRIGGATEPGMKILLRSSGNQGARRRNQQTGCRAGRRPAF